MRRQPTALVSPGGNARGYRAGGDRDAGIGAPVLPRTGGEEEIVPR